jgi:hypothetical protein
MDPTEISAVLGLEPSRMWRAGDPRTTPKNTPLEGVWRGTYWATDVLKDDCPNRTLAAALFELAERFSANKSFFAKVRNEGGCVEFYVGWFIDGNRGDEFGPDLMGKLVDLGITLSLDIYPLDTSTDVIPGERRIDDAS